MDERPHPRGRAPDGVGPDPDAGHGIDDEPEVADDLDAREVARIRRRDHDTGAEQRALMRAGMGKVFKQIIDSWGEKASPDQNRARKGAGKGHSRPR